MTRFALLAATVLLAAPPALAQTGQQRAQSAQGQTGTSNATPSATGNRAEVTTTQEFTRMASMSDRFEIASSRLAEQRSQNAQVKQFAQHMIRDHEKTTLELQRLMPDNAAATTGPRASGSGPAGSSAAGTTSSMTNAQNQSASLDQQHQALLRQLEGAQGTAFDQLYIRQQVQAHRQAVDLFSNYAMSGDNAQLKQWASATLPALQEHLRLAQQLPQGGRG
jgi:putative membrane protein